jgi:hypothetical protein
MFIYNWVFLISAMISILNKYKGERVSRPFTPRRALGLLCRYDGSIRSSRCCASIQ